MYRTLDLLVEEGLLLRTDLGAERAYYEPVREHPHHHLVCGTCGGVTLIHDEALGDLADTHGPREINFFGLCPACRAAEDMTDGLESWGIQDVRSTRLGAGVRKRHDERWFHTVFARR